MKRPFELNLRDISSLQLIKQELIAQYSYDYLHEKVLLVDAKQCDCSGSCSGSCTHGCGGCGGNSCKGGLSMCGAW